MPPQPFDVCYRRMNGPRSHAVRGLKMTQSGPLPLEIRATEFMELRFSYLGLFPIGRVKLVYESASLKFVDERWISNVGFLQRHRGRIFRYKKISQCLHSWK